MPILTPSANRIGLFAALIVGSAALAQDRGRDTEDRSAGAKIEEQGAQALDRLEKAVSRVKEEGGARPDPRLPARLSGEFERRAFDALSGRYGDAALDERARAALKAGEAALAREREDQAKRLRTALGLAPSEIEPGAIAPNTLAPTRWVPILFVSSSMPVQVLRNYAVQLEKVHGVLAFRGVPGGLKYMGPMAKLTAQILRVDPGCKGPSCVMRDVQLIVDPIVFRQHGVARVPALAMIPGDPGKPYCEREDESPRAAHLVYGDSALSGLLEEYARLGGAREVKDAQALLAAR